EALEHRRRDALIDGIPVDLILGGGIGDDELVARRAASVHAGERHERAAGGDLAFRPSDGVLVELRHAQVPMLRGEPTEALLVEADAPLEADLARCPVHHRVSSDFATCWAGP